MGGLIERNGVSFELRHYEIIALLKPSDEVLAENLSARLQSMVKDAGGVWDRAEFWENHALAYPVEKLTKAGYVLVNFTIDNGHAQKMLAGMQEMLALDNKVIRSLVSRTAAAQTGPSVVKQKKLNQKAPAEPVKAAQNVQRAARA